MAETLSLHLNHPLDIEILEESGAMVAHAPGDITLGNSAEIASAVLSAWESNGKPPRVIFDLSRVQHLDSSGAGVLVDLARKLRDRNSSLVVCGLGVSPRHMLARTGLDSLFPIFGTLDEALRGSVAPPDADTKPVSGTAAQEAGSPYVDPPHPPLPPGHRRRGRLEYTEQDRRHSDRVLWAFLLGILAILIGAGVYGYRAFGTYRGRLDMVPAIHSQLMAAGQRIDAAESALRDWGSQRDAWSGRLTRIEARLDGTVRTARKQVEEAIARAQQRMQADLDRRTATLQSRLDAVQSAQQSADARIASLTQELDQVKAANSREAGRLRQEFRDGKSAADAELANLNRQVTGVSQRADQSDRDLAAVHRRVDRERLGFEVSAHRDIQLAPGINLNVTHTDVRHQRFDGQLRLTADSRTLRVRGQGTEQPLVFYSPSDDQPRQLVISRVTKSSVAGYLVLPREAGSGGAASSENMQ
jgi:anti-anti-sigma factor